MMVYFSIVHLCHLNRGACKQAEIIPNEPGQVMLSREANFLPFGVFNVSFRNKNQL